ncbi:CPBP family intramembrane metalloprotease [Xylanimonas oleitrophica]|uniref:CPBP family intramembrane metalloprotease n=1 Tax=Xylanimonas oleitrophica TaxID=2607479 RepID=A0A2W5WXQ2_9MICO|nr:CPBP family intramembrane glutamic endopeptidase [Xylanimonas oleitrophica]PZR53086.1 CPBP family intramembrane metalloprotease [Xylanimonas oleitrophica]
MSTPVTGERAPVPGRWPALAAGGAAHDVLRLTAAALVSLSAVLLFAVHVRPLAYVPLVAGVALGLLLDRALGRDLLLIGGALAIISAIPLEADLSDAGIARFAVALSLAVLVPWAVSRYVYRDDAVRFPVLTGKRWTSGQWVYLVVVVVVGYLVLPWYFLGSGAYLNWPPLEGSQDIARLFVGVNAVGIWDELFFICTCFALLRRHFGLQVANVLQAVIFVSFLWELGYREWGPLLTVPFALVQGWIFARYKSLSYVVTVHLLFDAVVFGVLVHGHHPELFDVFVTAP